MSEMVRKVRVFVDADACPVKAEIYRVAERYRLPVFVVSNSLISIPASPLIERVVVEAGPDVADGWIAERAERGDIVVTSDVPLASRCVKAGAEVVDSVLLEDVVVRSGARVVRAVLDRGSHVGEGVTVGGDGDITLVGNGRRVTKDLPAGGRLPG